MFYFRSGTKVQIIIDLKVLWKHLRRRKWYAYIDFNLSVGNECTNRIGAKL